MKRIIVLSILIILQMAMEAGELRQRIRKEESSLHFVDYRVYHKGESITYLVHYGWLDAGIARIEVKNEQNAIRGKEVLHIVATGESTGAVDLFFKVRDRYETYIDPEDNIPYRFIRKVNEGGFTFEQDYTFDHEQGKLLTSDGDTFSIRYGTQDMISAYYFSRTIDLTKYREGDVISFTAFMDGKEEQVKIRYLGKENVKIKAGKFKCHKFQPLVQEGRVFNDSEDLTIYISDDKNKVPVLIKAKILVGNIKMELQSFEGLSYPLAKI